MHTGIIVEVSPEDRRRLEALVWDRNAPHKHVWRTRIVLLTDDDLGTNAIMRETGKSKTCVWRWQERPSCATWYVDPPAHAIVLSVDEKSQIQALDRTQPGLPLKKGRAGTMTHDSARRTL